MLPIIGCGNSPPLVEPLRLPKLADMLLWDPHHQFDEKRGECRRNPEPLANHVPLHVFPQRTVSDDVYTEALLLGLLSESFNGVGFQMESEGLRLDSTRSVGRRQNSQSPLKEALRPRGVGPENWRNHSHLNQHFWPKNKNGPQSLDSRYKLAPRILGDDRNKCSAGMRWIYQYERIIRKSRIPSLGFRYRVQHSVFKSEVSALRSCLR